MNEILSKEDWFKIGREYGKKGSTQLAQEIGISKQRVYQVVQRLRKEGVMLPRIREKKQWIIEVAEILKKERNI